MSSATAGRLMLPTAVIGPRRARNRHRIVDTVSSEVIFVPRSKWFRDPVCGGEPSDAQTSDESLVPALNARVSDVLSACDDHHECEHSDDGFTTTTRPDGAPTPTLRQTASEAMSARRIHARTVASDPASVRYDRKTRQSRGSPWGLKPSKTAPCARISGQVCHLSTIMTH